MKSELPVENKNKLWEHLVNWAAYCLTVVTGSPAEERMFGEKNTLRPLWITGFFRSGTSITTEILHTLGIDLGPSHHLLQPIGKRKNLNPRGFFENYIFMDFTLWIFRKLNSWGHMPPSGNIVEQFEWNEITYRKFVYHSIVTIHDDRISNWNKLQALRKYYPLNFDDYLRKGFKEPFAIKNIHISVLAPLFINRWPHSRFLVVFRNPDAAIISTKKWIVDTADYNLYTAYYSPLLKARAFDITYFSYDYLLKHPEYSVGKLIEKFSLDQKKITLAMELINPALNRNECDTKREKWPTELSEVYDEMMKRAINTSPP